MWIQLLALVLGAFILGLGAGWLAFARPKVSAGRGIILAAIVVGVGFLSSLTGRVNEYYIGFFQAQSVYMLLDAIAEGRASEARPGLERFLENRANMGPYQAADQLRHDLETLRKPSQPASEAD